jgi:DinB superfamily
MAEDAALRKHLVDLLRGGNAHADFDRTVGGLPARLRGARTPKLPFTPWRLLEHMRIAQLDILEFSRDAEHVSPDWPKGYWPTGDAPPSARAWEGSVAGFRRDLAAMEALVKNPATDLFARIPHGTGQTILREALLVADHNAYHLGQLLLLRRLLGAWKDR